MTSNRPKPKKQGNRSGKNGGKNQQPSLPRPSIWLDPENPPQTAKTASFVEYLRWMRTPNSDTKDGTKIELLQKAMENADYGDRLTQLTRRTRSLVGQEGTILELTCPWRIRVGGILGPENILLPAFDALGMPYIPSSTLRGVARSQAIREIMARDHSCWDKAEKKVAPYFGDLEADQQDRCGKVIFFDAYPLPMVQASTPSQAGNRGVAAVRSKAKAVSRAPMNGGLAVDIANNIWGWQDNHPQYISNPNPFFSLKGSTFVIGLRPMSGCSLTTFNQVKDWLTKGLCENGAGSQLNTGYGRLTLNSNGQLNKLPRELFRVEFELEGQLIHGYQKSNSDSWKWNQKNQRWLHKGKSEAEVRPIAFKSMVRYWFRTLALGVIPREQIEQLKRWENQIFGGIQPQQKLGWLRCHILDGKVEQAQGSNRNYLCGKQTGILVLSHAPETPIKRQHALTQLSKTLTWIMFHLGGVGQGARRPCYQRSTLPYWRGSTLIPLTNTKEEEEFWDLPETIGKFTNLFRCRLKAFYQSLQNLTELDVDYDNPQSLEIRDDKNWEEAIDRNCQIVICSGRQKNKKIYALSVLHSPEFNPNGNYDPDLCGRSSPAKPSPVWISDINAGDEIAYQVVTVFGANVNPRNKFLEKLKQEATAHTKVWPFPKSRS
ncbi:RAMP superfamily CRISPR-associated protein [Moorena sp. SIO3H5]|uniref:RAMP superfamily CRISPR-associated protein n=1 Tax=Moorena sp. SIO3H5 TaxID=2607834 RepID=UPI0013BD6EE5|nr:RAMP superfamily CRISPR-associated protein [Moorena sp. SIO3H5]NEO72182.1 type III-B CRISPR module RAMP protein Cmr6 [Moorena sp. SIO3H5]